TGTPRRRCSATSATPDWRAVTATPPAWRGAVRSPSCTIWATPTPTRYARSSTRTEARRLTDANLTVSAAHQPRSRPCGDRRCEAPAGGCGAASEGGSGAVMFRHSRRVLLASVPAALAVVLTGATAANAAATDPQTDYVMNLSSTSATVRPG